MAAGDGRIGAGGSEKSRATKEKDAQGFGELGGGIGRGESAGEERRNGEGFGRGGKKFPARRGHDCKSCLAWGGRQARKWLPGRQVDSRSPLEAYPCQ